MAGVLKVEGPGPTLNRIQLDRRPQTVDKHGEISTVLQSRSKLLAHRDFFVRNDFSFHQKLVH